LRKLKETGMRRKESSNKNFAILTDNEWNVKRRQKDEKIGKLQIKLGKTKGECTRLSGRFSHIFYLNNS